MPANILSIINLFDVSRTHFVQDAYAVILGREPDPEGSATYEKLLGTGASRLRRKIIIALATSSEARRCSPLLPMIAAEAMHIQRWRFLPWNRSAVTLSAFQAESQSSTAALAKYVDAAKSVETKLSSIDEKLLLIEHAIEALKKSVETKLSSTEEKFPLIEHAIEALKKSVETKLSSTEEKFPLIEHAIDALKKSAETKLSSTEEKFPLIEHAIDALKKSAETKLASIEEKLPLIEHTMRSLKGLSFALHRLEDTLGQHTPGEHTLSQQGFPDNQRDAA